MSWAGVADAAVVYSTSGISCIQSLCQTQILVGQGEDSPNFSGFRSGAPYVGSGNYAYELDINPALVTAISVVISPWNIWDEWFNGQPIGGNETRAPMPDATFQTTPTGYTGTFSVKNDTDVTSMINLFGQDGLLRRQDSYLTAVTIYANLSGSLVPYAFTLSRIDAVPEPKTWALMLGGFFVVGAMLRGRRKATA